MSKNKQEFFISPALYNENNFTLIFENTEVETGTLEISSTGNIVIRNTGGSSAAEGGMGSGSDDKREKGELTKPGEGAIKRNGNSGADEGDSDTSFDPVKKDIKEAEKAAGRD